MLRCFKAAVASTGFGNKAQTFRTTQRHLGGIQTIRAHTEAIVGEWGYTVQTIMLMTVNLGGVPAIRAYTEAICASFLLVLYRPHPWCDISTIN